MKWRKAGVAFWCSFVVALAAFSAFFVLLVYHAGRGFMLTDAWMAQNYWLKDVFAERMKSPKIVLLGGSAMAFSIDSSVIEEMCGMPVINLGLHAGLPFRFCLESVSRHVKKGDVVVVALEFNEHFGAGEEKIYSDLSICAMLGMAPEFQRTLTPRQLLQLYFGYGCKWLDHLIANLGDAHMVKQDRDSVMDDWTLARDMAPAGGFKPGYGYELHYLNEHGDRLMPFGKLHEIATPQTSLPMLSAEFLAVFDSLSKKVSEKGARLCMTYPNLFFYLDYESMTSLKDILSRHGITLWGRPSTLSFPSKYYYDTHYHMTGPGARLYSRELAKTICRFAGLPYELSKGTERVVSFQEHPETIHAGGCLQWYDTGIIVTNQSFSISMLRPPGMVAGPWVCEFIIDRCASDGEVVKSVSIGDRRLGFHEDVRKAKNKLSIRLPAEVSVADLNFVLKDCAVVGVGLESVFIDNEGDLE